MHAPIYINTEVYIDCWHINQLPFLGNPAVPFYYWYGISVWLNNSVDHDQLASSEAS